MVHRHPDSRLLSSLLTAETAYSKQLQTLLSHSNSSLAAFSAYAAASAPPTSHVIISVATCFAGADGAVEMYVQALEEWKECLKQVKEAEDEVSNILRDRDILVTRLLKASKPRRSNRDSLASIRASMSETSLVPSGKLASAQAELQACEAQFSAKEKQLGDVRMSLIKKGLEVRCRALVECSTRCEEMGWEALKTLDSIASGTYKPLPTPYHDPDRPPSDLSSLTPSQSASQINVSLDSHAPHPSNSRTESTGSNFQVHVPPAHSISEFALPHALARRITEEPEGSSDSEDEGPVEIRDNEPFTRPANTKKASTFSVRGGGGRGHVRFPTSVSDVGPVWEGDRGQRRRSRSLFGGLVTLWKGKSHMDEGRSPQKASSSAKGWQTRTDGNLRRRRDSDSGDEGPRSRAGTLNAGGSLVYGAGGWTTAGAGGGDSSVGGTGAHRLKKKVGKRDSVKDKGWMSDGAAASSSFPPRTRKGKERAVEDIAPSTSFPSASSYNEPKPIPITGLPSGTLSRDSSISRRSVLSAASAPPITARSPVKSGVGRSSSVLVTNSYDRRGGSLDRPRPSGLCASTSSITWADSPSPSRPTSTILKDTPQSTRSQRRMDGLPNSGSQSLMSIVENVSKLNRAGWAGDMEMPRAPPPVTRDMVEAELADSSERSRKSDLTPSNSVSVRNSRSTRTSQAHAGQQGVTVHQPVRGMKPLKSALRSPSPSPSPVPDQKIQLHDTAVKPLPNGNANTSPSPNPRYSPPPVLPSIHTSPLLGSPLLSDATASIASFDTVREGALADDNASMMSFETALDVLPLDAGDQERPTSPMSGSTASTDTKVNLNGGTSGGKVNAPTAAQIRSETPTATPPVRRKSVRMSLEPTFSRTPPALDEGTYTPWEEERKRESRSNGDRVAGDAGDGWSMRNGSARAGGEGDLWEDSSAEEDEDYRTARRLLTKVGKGF